MLNIQKGPAAEPLRLLIHGQAGIGKTTLANGAPKALFISPEDGGGDLDLDRVLVTSWPETIRALETVRDDASLDYETVVIDTIDALERLCWDHVCKASKAANIEDVGGGYGKGYTMALGEYARVMALLDQIRASRRMAVIILSHSKVKNFDDPSGPAYARYQLAMNEKAALAWTGWADCVLFAQMDVRVGEVKTGKGGAKGKARDEVPDRILCTEPRAQYDAKNRIGLPPEIPLGWAEFADASHWNDRMERARTVRPAPQVAADPAPGLTIGEAAAKATAELGWRRADVLDLLERHGATDPTKPSTVPAEQRKIVVSILSKRFDPNQEEK